MNGDVERLRYAIAKQALCAHTVVTKYGDIDLLDVFDDEHISLFLDCLESLLCKQLSVLDRGDS